MMTAPDDDEAAKQEVDRQDASSAEPHASPADTNDIHTYIGARLRKAFDDVAKQPVPERLLQLMRDLDQA